jgi:hydrogenase maturation protein HypF
MRGLASEAQPSSRRGVRVRGTVQAVGFRPTVFRLARELGLGGEVRNDGEGVWIELEGDLDAIARFCERLPMEAPAPARIAALETFALAPRDDAEFRIVESSHGAGGARVPADAAPCDACLAELDDPRDRRHRHAFINCTACGPRYTIVREVPYDRARTTMDVFALCDDCAREYATPASRRFHAEAIACPRCGPRLRYFLRGGATCFDEEALAQAAHAIASGRIVAVKGAGGFLLAADARDAAAIDRLRARKHRPHKPLAVMARDLDEAARVAELSETARAALLDAARPIVLVPLRQSAALPRGLAPGLSELGVMLPSTPLHHLLLRDGPALQVMTSGNRAGEPIARDDDEAQAQLATIADAFLTHDRAVHARADDSVVRIVAGAPQPVRRARGLVPDPIALPIAGPPLVAVGAELKNTVCVSARGEAVLSPHVGDLGAEATLRAFAETIAHLERLTGVRPEYVAHDRHPDYHSTRWALAQPLPRFPVQHHHAHVAACLAEHGRTGPAIGVAFDGTGCGPAGEIWGGEFLLADLGGFERVGHLWPLRLAGGEAAIRQPWRMAQAALRAGGLGLSLIDRIEPRRLAAIDRLLAGAPRTSSAGRWFDAAAALCAVRDEVSYEGQAAVELEAACAPGVYTPYPVALEGADPFVVDLRPAIAAMARALEQGDGAGPVAARFYETMAHAVELGCERARAASGVETVALSGGCFQSARLTEQARARLAALGFEVLIHCRVPPNDGGVSLGQAAVASCALARRSDVSRHSR